MVKSTFFTNWTDEDFTHNWDSTPWSFKAGEGKWMDNHLARHFAKHLATREIFKIDKPLNSAEYKGFFEQCLGESIEAESPEKLQSVLMEKKVEEVRGETKGKTEETSEVKSFCDQCDSKGVRHLKVCPTLTSDDEESFEGLKK